MTREEFDSLYYGKAAHCDTEEKAKEFLALAESVGYIWFGDTRAPEFTKWEIFKDDTHYFVKNFLWNGKSIEHGSGDYYLKYDIDCVEFNKKKSDKDSRNKINDYNIKMLEALHAVFWYEGLLEQDGDEWVEFKNGESEYPYARPKYKEDCFIILFIKGLREHNSNDFFTFNDVEKIDKEFQWQSRHTVIWQMLVEMFGNCGTSPRTGWIEQNKECADFLEQIVGIEELVYDNTNRIKGN